MSALRRLRAFGVMTIALFALFVAPAPAQAQPLDPILFCPFITTATVSPGVGLFPVVQQFGGVLYLGTRSFPGIGCTSPSLPIVGGETVGSGIDGSGPVSCVPSLGGFGAASGTITVRWFDGNDDSLGTSIAAWTLAVGGLTPVVTIEVVGGSYAPLIGTDVIVTSVVPTSINGDCLFHPIVSLGFTATGVFVPLPV